MANEPNERAPGARSFAVEFISWNPLGQPKLLIACVKPPETAKPLAFTRPVHFFVAPPHGASTVSFIHRVIFGSSSGLSSFHRGASMYDLQETQ